MLRTSLIALVALGIEPALADAPQAQSREDALAVIARTASAHGYELKHYALSTSSHELSEDGKEWSFHYECIPPPVSPGFRFLVTVSRLTGVPTFMPGE